MAIPYDETFEEFERRTGLDAFFSDYSTEVRGKLLSKNLERPKDIYDVIYPQIREDNLSKNVISKSDLEIDSQIIRETLTKSLVSRQESLEESGELQRKRLESKNKLIESSKTLEDFGEESRKSAIQKNISIVKTIDAVAKEVRSENARKNVNKTTDIEKLSAEYRESSILKNIVRDNNPYNPKIDIDAPQFRTNNTNRNENVLTNLEVESNTPRELNQSKNINVKTDLLNKSESERSEDLRKNVPKASSLEADSGEFRNNIKSKNVDKNSNLEIESNSYRVSSLKNNTSNQTNLEIDSTNTRSSIESKNKSSNSDLNQDSNTYRQNVLSKNEKSKNNLEEDSEEIRNNVLGKNLKVKSNLESDSAGFRNKINSKNDSQTVNLESFSENFRADSTSKNDNKGSDLESFSKSFRQEDLQTNVPNGSNLENDSVEFRQDDLSANDPKPSNLEFKSSVYRQDDLSYNSPKNSDLEADSFPYREDDLSNNNNPTTSNLEFDSETFRQEDLSANNDIESDLGEDSILFRNNDLSSNVPSPSDLEIDSEDFRDNNLNPNVPSNSELVGDSFQYLANSVATNVPNDSDLEEDSQPFRLDNLFSNVTQPEDLAAQSISSRNDNLASNVSQDSDLGAISKPERDDQQSSNVSLTKDIDKLSNVFRNEQLAKNPSRFSLGTNVILEGTSTFVGVSRLEISGAIFREANKILNGNKEGLDAVFDDDESIKFFEETASNQLSPGGREYLTDRNLEQNLPEIEGKGNIFNVYGTTLVDDTSRLDDGLGFYTSPKSIGFITNLISLHNIQQNTFQSKPGQRYDAGVQNAIEGLRGFGSTGFQELISKTGIDKRLQLRTNSTPAEVISENNGKYLSESSEKIIRTTQPDEELGTGVSMASQTDTTDAIGVDFDRAGSRKRGVRQIIDTIASDDRIAFAQNFNVQGQEGSSSVFVVGKESDGKYKKSYNRYSIKNPYAPQGAETLRFVLQNYSIPAIEGQAMAFPAYIASWQHGDSATWNSTNFLGRPEPIYTYGNSSRDGSVSFFVLTDFATAVDIGYEFNPESGQVTKLTEQFGDRAYFSSIKRQDSAEADELRAQARTQENSITDIPPATATNGLDFFSPANRPNIIAQAKENARQKRENEEATRNARQFKERANQLEDSANLAAQRGQTFSERTSQGENIYKFFEGFDTQKNSEGYIENKPEDTAKKIAQMRRKLMFQPSYFSGSKVDFLKRMEFISKMTRPARNRLSERTNNGFSFSKPPVCHLTLGDWLDHDIIVNSVAYDYADAPWTFDGGRTQPMWCKVTLNFNIIGAYGAVDGEDPPLSTDVGGYFSRRIST